MFRSRPKGVYIHEANWEELYVLTEHWKKDLGFYKEDLLFLHRLIDKYFIWIVKEENNEAVRKILHGVQKMKDKCRDLLEKVSSHLNRVGNFVEKPEPEEDRLFRIEHEHLEDEIADFVKAFRKNRRDVFEITEHVVDSEKLIGLLEN